MTRTLLAGLGGLVVACAPSARGPSSNPGATPMHSSTHVLAIIDLHVASFDEWKSGFDGHAAARKGAGVLSARVNRSADDPNAVTVCLVGSSFESLQTFLASPERAEVMKKSGVLGTPTTTMATVIEDLSIKDRPLAGAFVRHRVADFETWKRGFDGRAAARAQGGVIGHSVARTKDDPGEVIVFLQAENVEALRAFTGGDDLKSAMIAGGVQGAPRISFVQSLSPGQ